MTKVVTKLTPRESLRAPVRKLWTQRYRRSRKCNVREVDHREVLAMLSAGAQIVDVLPAQEYNETHIKGAAHIPLPRILADSPTLLDRSQRTVVYCRDSL